MKTDPVFLIALSRFGCPPHYTPAAPDEVPGEKPAEREGHEQSHLCLLEAPEPLVQGISGEVADAGDERRPDERADEVEQGEPPRRDAAGADNDRPRDAQAVEKAQHDHRWR